MREAQILKPAAPPRTDALAARPDWRREALLALCAAGVLIASAIWPADGLPTIIVCPMRVLTRLPCPGCGLTRAFSAISHGHLAQAWRFNPFGYLLYPVVLYLLLRPAARRALPRFDEALVGSFLSGYVPLALAVGMLVFGLVRIVCLVV